MYEYVVYKEKKKSSQNLQKRHQLDQLIHVDATNKRYNSRMEAII